MSKRKKWSLIGGGVLVIAIIGFTTAAKNRNKATEVRIEPVERRDLVASVTASGQVQPQTKVDLSADITGRIVRLSVKEGDMVVKGHRPRLALVVHVDEVFSHCSKAFMRSALWDPATWTPDAGSGLTLWAVLRDGRGGVDWAVRSIGNQP